MEQGIVFSYFGGVSEGFSWAVDFDKVLFELARWLLPIGICLLAEGVCMEKRRKIEPLSCWRYETVKRWWRRKYVGSLLSGISVAAVLFMAAMAADLVSAADLSGAVWRVFFLWFAHIAMILSLFLVLDLTKLRRAAPAILLVLEGVTFLAGFQFMERARFLFGMWGMYFQSGWYSAETGVPAAFSLMMEGILLVIGYLTGGILLKKAIKDGQGTE